MDAILEIKDDLHLRRRPSHSFIMLFVLQRNKLAGNSHPNLRRPSQSLDEVEDSGRSYLISGMRRLSRAFVDTIRRRPSQSFDQIEASEFQDPDSIIKVSIYNYCEYNFSHIYS